jgi:hypothetical protein
MVPLMLYAAYFYDALQIKLKVQEAARFATFEWANNPLHDYHEGTSSAHRRLQQRARNSIEDGVRKIYRDLNSATSNAPPVTRLAVNYTEPRVRARLEEAPLIVDATALINLPPAFQPFRSILSRVYSFIVGLVPLSISSTIVGPLMGARPPQGREAQGLALMVPGLRKSIRGALRDWGFNMNTRAVGRVDLRVENVIIPRRFGSGWMSDTIVGRRVPPLRYRTEYFMIADSWRLYDGSEIRMSPTTQLDKDTSRGGRDADSGYYRTVDRIAQSLVSKRRGWEGPLYPLYETGAVLGRLAGLQGHPTETKLVSLDYARTPDRGRRPVRIDQGTHARHTAEGEQVGEYADMLRERGPYFMGCPGAQDARCWVAEPRRGQGGRP